jgi:hypothetical protein
MIMDVEGTGFSRLRPTPLDDAARRAVKIAGTISALLTALAGSGIAVLTAEQADALTALVGATPGLIALAGAAMAAFGTAAQAKPDVTPVDDPRDNQGNMLVPGTRRS